MSMSIAEAKSQFSALIARAEAGEEITITKHGRPVAKVTGLDPSKSQDKDDLRRRMREGRTATLGYDWKALRDFGRRF